MKERPILFSAPMVRAILNGTKTQTRRVVKPWNGAEPSSKPAPADLEYLPDFTCYRSTCPYGQPGDQLWVRESFQPFLADGVDHWKANWETGEGYAVGYPATDGIKEFIDADDNLKSTCKPSIHMPRWASRILLEVVSVRVERLQDISVADAIAEGIEPEPETAHWKNYDTSPGGWRYLESPIQSYRTLWNSINGPDAWDANPWVWVVEFKRMEGGAA
jgi:hypothetical protein